MSYILDALKKSDQERQENTGPTLQTVHRPRLMTNRNGSMFWFGLIILLLVVLLATVWFYFTYSADPTRQETSALQVLGAGASEKVNSTARVKPEITEPSSVGSAPVVEFGELPDPIKKQIPPLTFSFHVYSDNPDRRTIIINKRRAREGVVVESDLRLDEITEEGVVLSWQSHRFYINVVESW
jgi:general secretion pathway protein B